MSTISKTDIAASLANLSGITKAAAETAVDNVFNKIIAELKEGNDVRVHGFGTFTRIHRPERQGRNPATGAPITVKASDSVKFKPATALKG